ncbi:hypothetical protein O3M35_003080 [Rhynocoris fuscipes]|uniref:7-dehydrocholesterol reductase n=1 Tax=Rhynocoris fuscipes TaxID=488301 RepID=A0AAW1CL83_9HEMI
MNLYEKFKLNIVPPIFLIVFTSSVQFLALFGKGEPITFNAIKTGLIGNFTALKIVFITFIWSYIFLIISSKETKGIEAPNGYVPTYKANGVSYYLITATTYLICHYLWPNISTAIYDNMPQILGIMNTIALLFCTYLFLKSDEGSDLPKLYIFYRGRELHPTIFNVQVKQLIITRISLMFWQIQVFAFFFTTCERRTIDLPTTVTFLLQTIYLFKTFIYESAYFHTLDITLDRAGYYLIWGCLVWLPCIFPYVSYYLVTNKPTMMSTCPAILILVFGTVSIICTALVDFQKATFRRTNGKALIWNRRPTFIKAEYKDTNGKLKTSLLLTSGFWGQARHLNYTFELLSNLSWALPAYSLGLPPFLFIIFLTILILHRIYRDEDKCRNKYGKYWQEYCKIVPYRLIPYVV